MTQQELKQLIIDTVYTNTEGEIEGDPVQDVLLEMVDGSTGITPEGNYQSAPIKATGGGTIQLVNGSDIVTGIGTQFNAAGFLSMAYNYWLLVNDGTTWWFGSVNTINSDTELLMFSWIDATNDPNTELPATFPGVSGTYDWYLHGVTTTDQAGECSIAIGHMVLQKQSTGGSQIGIGRYMTMSGDRNVGLGYQISMTGNVGSVGVGSDVKLAGGAGSRNIGIGNQVFLLGERTYGLGTNISIDDSHIDCGLIAANNSSMVAAGAMTNVVAIGFVGEASVGAAGLTNVVAAPNFFAQNIPTYADEAAATVGGLITGTFYKTATGELRIKL